MLRTDLLKRGTALPGFTGEREVGKVKREGNQWQRADTSPASVLEKELGKFRRELRLTFRAYSARLEMELAEITAAVAAERNAKPSREKLHELRELLILLRKRKLKPQKGRRKDLRKLDLLIREIHSITHPNAGRDI
jgi:hypothetical protein